MAAQSLRDGNTRFADDLYQRVITKNAGEDVILSPFSISTALSMVWLGARGVTATEMARTLHFELPEETHHPAWRELLARFSDDAIEEIDLRIANRLWGQVGFSILPLYLDQGRDYYNAPLVELDFKGDTEPSRVTINDWVADQTADRIKDLIPPGALDRTTRLVLTNAIYMKADWARPFQKYMTREGEFTRIDQTTSTVSYMNQEGRFSYGDWNDWQVLEMPYKGGRLAMVVLLPRETGGLATLEGDLDLGAAMEFVRTGLSANQVDIRLPRFRSELTLPLTDTLQEMGMRTPFGMQADFRGMTGDDELYLSSVIHKAFIEVDEMGTEAAAATAAVMATKSLVLPGDGPVRFHATHPFVYIIHDRETGSVLFLGRVMNPRAGGD